ncbi:MAG TPA: FHA domain-containing protein [Kofleriaceae bacterium]|nr:FHA domain-containing protein [Kofleriaceae bacterium]
MSATTSTDCSATEWWIDDEVIQLREWGTESIHRLPECPWGGVTIGSADTCALRLVDPNGLISRKHAWLERSRQSWNVHDLDSRNGIRIDGVRRSEGGLDPGAELGIGGFLLIPESRRFIKLRSFVARLLGYAPEKLEAVDLALRSIRLAVTRRMTLVLCGPGDMVLVAHAIHRRALGDSRPFVVCDPRRREGQASVRSAGNVETGLAAIKRARGGSLCVWSQRLPPDFEEVRVALRDPTTRVQLIVCMQPWQRSRPPKPNLIDPIIVPPLHSRPDEIDRIISECAEEAAATLLTNLTLTASDREWIVRHSAASVCEVEKGVRRILAIRQHDGDINTAARALGMARVSLERWFGRRRWPTEQDAEAGRLP